MAALAWGLARSGMSGCTVAWMLATTPAAIELAMAMARVGAVSVPLNPRLAAAEVDFMLRDCDATVVIDELGAGLCDELRRSATRYSHGPLHLGDDRLCQGGDA